MERRLDFLMPRPDHRTQVRFIGNPQAIYLRQVAKGRFYFELSKYTEIVDLLEEYRQGQSLMAIVSHVIDRSDGELKLMFVDPLEMEGVQRWIMAMKKLGKTVTPNADEAVDFRMTASTWWNESPNKEHVTYELYKESRNLIWFSEACDGSRLTEEEKKLLEEKGIEDIRDYMRRVSLYQPCEVPTSV